MGVSELDVDTIIAEFGTTLDFLVHDYRYFKELNLDAEIFSTVNDLGDEYKIAMKDLN